jgi:hypothetical protein
MEIINPEKILEMFPTKNEQRNAERVLESLLKNYNINAFQVSELLSPNKSFSAINSQSQGINQVLTNLYALGIIDSNEGIYNPNDISRKALDFLYSLCKSKRKTQPISDIKPKFVALFCASCGAIISTKGSSKTTVCKICYHKNNLEETGAVFLIRTNNRTEFLSTIKEAKMKRYYDKIRNQLTAEADKARKKVLEKDTFSDSSL